MNTVEVLTKAKEIISDPSNWIKKDYTNGRGCFCALGAIAQAYKGDNGFVYYGDSSGTPAGQLLKTVVKSELTAQGYSESVTFAPYNDTHTHAEVMAAFDKAIYLAQVEQGDVIKL